MVTVNPTYSDVRWGPEQWQYLDYYANPTRVTGGNPLLIMTPATGWNTRSHRTNRTSGVDEKWYFMRYLLGGQDINVTGDLLAAMPKMYWDVCTPCTGQQNHDSAVFAKSRQLYGMDVIRDEQRMIASVKSLYGTYGFNPSKIIRAGSSATALNAMIAQLAPARIGGGGGKTWLDSNYARETFDSTVRGVIYSEGPIDLRNSGNDNPPSGTDYFHYTRAGALLGTYNIAGDATEWNAVPAAVKAALSVRAYFENEDLASFPGMYILFRPAGNGVLPLGDASVSGSDPHDSRQLADLLAAAFTAGVNVPGTLVNDSAWDNNRYPTNIDPKNLTLYRSLSDWMANQVNSNSRIP